MASHFEIWRQYADETGVYAERFPTEMVCIRPTRPLCYCRPDERLRAVGGLQPSERLDVTTATPEELTQLPGIGPGLARRITIYRKEHGFQTAADLLEVNGIGPSRYERIRPLVRVSRE